MSRRKRGLVRGSARHVFVLVVAAIGVGVIPFHAEAASAFQHRFGRGGTGAHASASRSRPAIPPIKRPSRADSVTGLGSASLQSVVRAVRAKGLVAAAGVARSAGLDVTSLGVRVILVVRPGGLTAARTAVGVHGGTVERTAGNLVQALVPVGSLSALASDPSVDLVRPPAHAVAQALVAGEEVGTLNAAGPTASGYDGAGVKVGIIDVGFQGYAALLGTELPVSVTTHDLCGGKLSTASEHGTAVAEIVHEVAPGAELYLICIGTEVDLATAEAYAKAQGIKIVNHSVGWFNSSRGDGSGGPGTPDAIVADAKASGILWVNAAGNEAQNHWGGTFVDDGGGFNVFSGATDLNRLVIAGGAQVCIELKWDAWPTTNVDYDLYLFRSSDLSLPVAASEGDQAGLTRPPTEEICYTNAGATDVYAVAIKKFAASSAPRLDLFVLGASPIEFQTPAGSLVEPASSPNALAVGAVCWNGFGLESYSSRGPNIAGVVKPDISGYDSVSSLTYGAASTCGGAPGFAGTSAAAPGIAGVAALLLQQYPALTPAQLQAKITSFGVDLGASGKDNLYGSGREVLPTPPQNAVLPNLSGTAQTGSVLSAATGTWTGSPTPTFTYQFERCDAGGASCSNVGSTTPTASLVLTSPVDTGKTIRVKVTATNAGGSAAAESAATVQIAGPPVNTIAPSLSGTATSGSALSTTDGTWTAFPAPTFTYGWSRCDPDGVTCVSIAAETASSYVLVAADEGHTVRAVVTATNGSGAALATSPMVGVSGPPLSLTPPSISGTTQTGEILTAHAGSWLGVPAPAFTFQWERCDPTGGACSDIVLATSATYVPGVLDLGLTLRVKVSASNASGGAGPVESAPTAVVSAPPSVGGGGGGGGGGGSGTSDLVAGITGPAVAKIGDSITYQITAQDRGTGGSNNVVATITLPVGVTLGAVSFDRGQGCTGAAVLTCKLDFLNGGLVANIRLDVQAVATGSLVATVVLSSSKSDANPADNTVSLTTVVAPAVIVPPAPKLAREGVGTVKPTRRGTTATIAFAATLNRVARVRLTVKRVGAARSLMLLAGTRVGRRTFISSTLTASSVEAPGTFTVKAFVGGRTMVKGKAYVATLVATTSDARTSTLTVKLVG